MAELWYFTRNGQPMDPIPAAELKRMAAAGDLKPTDLVWKEGMPNWVKASAAKGLFDNPIATATSSDGGMSARASSAARRTKASSSRSEPAARIRAAECSTGGRTWSAVRRTPAEALIWLQSDPGQGVMKGCPGAELDAR